MFCLGNYVECLLVTNSLYVQENEEPDAKRQGKDGRGAGPSGSAPMVTCKLVITQQRRACIYMY